jgi:SAM-dependent methyltransferase
MGTGNEQQLQPIDPRTRELQEQLNDYWSTRREITGTTPLLIRTERELQVWMDVLRPLLPPAPSDVVDLGTGRGFLALVFAALGHRSRGFDLADGMLEKAREAAAGLPNPPVFESGDAMVPPLEPASVDVVANRNVLWTLLDPERAFRNWFAVLRPGGRLIVVHGVNTGTAANETAAKHDAAYTAEIRERLIGIYREPTLEPAVEVARRAGFVDIQVQPMPTVEELERELETESGQPVSKVWLVLTATRP